MTKGIYIHIPFCNKKCNYCSFYSVADLAYKSEFLQALKKEMEYKQTAYPDFFESGDATLYIGGGNPALLDQKEIEGLFKIIRQLPFRYTEATIEANPDSITGDKAGLYKELGINRVSVGVQAFDDEILRFLGRNHAVGDALSALDVVGKYFENFSIDLIGGIPVSSQFPPQGGTKKSTVHSSQCSEFERDWEKEFGYISQYRPPHLSFYLLSIEKGSEFYGNIKIDEDKQSRDYEIFCEYVRDMDYEHYEVSNFCKPGRSCRHNELYWERKEYMGFGPSAVSFVTQGSGIQGIEGLAPPTRALLRKGKKGGLSGIGEMRIKNVSNIHSYIKVPALSEIEMLSKEDSFLETIFLSLRTAKGFNIKELESSFPGRTAGLEERLLSLEKSGFTAKHNDRWIIPEKHLIISNEIILELMKETDYA